MTIEKRQKKTLYLINAVCCAVEAKNRSYIFPGDPANQKVDSFVFAKFVSTNIALFLRFRFTYLQIPILVSCDSDVDEERKKYNGVYSSHETEISRSLKFIWVLLFVANPTRASTNDSTKISGLEMHKKVRCSIKLDDQSGTIEITEFVFLQTI